MQSPNLFSRSRAALAILLFITVFSLGAQDRPALKKVSVAFYNLENIFDTIDQANYDEEFLPKGANKWNSERYYNKVKNMSYAISQICGDGLSHYPGSNPKGLRRSGPAILGLSEVENINPLKDLVNSPALRNNNYAIVHYDSPDARGVDVAFFYCRDIFTLEESYAHHTDVPENPHFRTRDIVRMTGTIDGERFHFMVAHWPSRSGGQKVSEYKRMGAARTMRRICDSLIAADPESKIVLMGDFNDDPVDKSLRYGLKIAGSTPKPDMAPQELFCPMLRMFKDGMGSLAYQDSWNLFDILVVNGNLVNPQKGGFQVLPDNKTRHYAYIFRRPFLLQREGRYKGYPHRTFAGGQYQNGYSDHLPVYLYLVK